MTKNPLIMFLAQNAWNTVFPINLKTNKTETKVNENTGLKYGLGSIKWAFGIDNTISRTWDIKGES